MKCRSQIMQCLKEWFNFPVDKTYCQVSTLADRLPHIRTMRLYHVTAEGHLVLLTETSTRKWQDLKKCPRVAICLLNPDRGKIIAEAGVTLITAVDDNQTAAFYWNQFLDQYWRDYHLSLEASTAGIPSSFGVIMVQPDFWETLVNEKIFE